MIENTNKYKNLYNIYKSKNRDEVFALINSLTLEEVIALKLELSSKELNGRLFGFDIWASATNIIKEAILIYAISATKSKRDAARFLGISRNNLIEEIKNYQIDKYFSDRIDSRHHR